MVTYTGWLIKSLPFHIMQKLYISYKNVAYLTQTKAHKRGSFVHKVTLPHSLLTTNLYMNDHLMAQLI